MEDIEKITHVNHVLSKVDAAVYEANLRAISFRQEKILKKETLKKASQMKKARKRRDFIVGTVGAITTLLIIGSIKIGTNLNEKAKFRNDLKAAKGMICDQIEDQLQEIGINPNDYVSLQNADYSKLDSDITEKELYGYFEVLGYNDSEEIVKLITPTPEDHDYYSNYTGWSSFCARNGYFDEGKNPSVIVWENYMEADLVAAYREGTLSYTKEGGKIK